MRRLFPLLLLLWLAGCTVAPDPVYRVQPAEPSGIWLQGQEVLTDEKDGLSVAVKFEACRNGRLIYIVEIANHSTRTVVVDPAAFGLATTTMTDETIDLPPRYGAADPEKMLVYVDRGREATEARAATEAGRNAFYDLMTIAEGFTTRDETEAERQRKAQEATEEQARRLREEQEIERRLQRLDSSRYRWSEETLRKTTVGPGQAVGGKVNFGVVRGSELFVLDLPIGRHVFTFHYRLLDMSTQYR